MFDRFMEWIGQYDRIIIHRHSSPDGDALGSQIGLKHILRDAFPEKQVYAVGDSAGRYAFMDGSEMDEVPDEWFLDALAIILDTSAQRLISDKRYATAKATARMDHHLFCEPIAQVEVVDPSFESCCGLVTQFAITCGLPVSAAAAKALYTGMVTDSGRFRYEPTGPRTFRLAAFLRERPFDARDIYQSLYANDYDQLCLRARFILKMDLSRPGIASIYTTREEMRELGQDTFSISRGMVNVMADIRGVEAWANFTETEEGVLCELRSNRLDIHDIAVQYGGGGHANACGATLKDRQEAMRLLDDLQKRVQP